jgi:SAM-dependent methyltransferase
VPVQCPVCLLDEAEPVAVGEDFAHRVTEDSFLAVGCPGCGLVYLSPQPAFEEHARVYPPSYFSPARGDRAGRGGARRARAAARRAVRACGSLRPDARVLEVCYGATVHLDGLRASGPRTWVLEAVTPHETLARSARHSGFTVCQGYPHELEHRTADYDAVLLLYGLEHCPSPVEELESIGRLLRPGGMLLILTENADSTVGRLFRGRHWAGYDFPRHRALFGPRPLHRLAEATGFEVTRIRTLPASEPWLRSAALLLQDWASQSRLASIARLATPFLSGLAWIVDAGCSLRGRGARLEAALRKPETNPR